MLRLLPFLPLGGCFLAPRTPTNQSTSVPPPYITASLTDDGTDAPTLDVSLCYQAFFSCNSTVTTDVITVCDGAGCRTFDPTTPYGSSSLAENVSTTVTLGASPVHVEWEGHSGDAGFQLPLPDAFTPSTDRSTYAAGDVVKVTWTPSPGSASMSYSIDQVCDTSGSSGAPIPIQAVGTADPGELDVMAGTPGLSGQTCHVTLTLLRELPAVLDSGVTGDDLRAHAAEARSVTFTVTE